MHWGVGAFIVKSGPWVLFFSNEHAAPIQHNLNLALFLHSSLFILILFAANIGMILFYFFQ